MTGSQTSTDELGEYQQLLDQKKPGAAIKFLREAKGVSLERITRETLIPDWKLSDLENDAYGGLGGPIFVMGYLRKVAKILNVDSDPLIEAYDYKSNSTQEGHPTLAGEVITKRRGNNLLNKINRIPGLVIIAALLLVWVGTVVTMKSVGTGEESPSTPASHEVDDAPRAAQSRQASSDVVEQDVPDTVVSAGTGDGPVTPAQLEELPAPVAVAVEPVAVESVSEAQISGTVTEPTPRPESVDGEDLLTVVFIQDCWVQVTDATGKVLFAQLQRTGDNLQLFGQAPFRVMLGNARAVEIMLNGEVFAFSPILGRDTLRLTVGP